MLVQFAWIVVLIGVVENKPSWIDKLIQYEHKTFHALDHSDHEVEKDQCSYKGYSPAYQERTINKPHATADILLDVITSNLIGTEMAIGNGVLDSLGTAAGSAEDFLKEVQIQLAKLPKVSVRTQMFISNGLKQASGILRGLAIMSPVLGIISAALGAAIDVNTPTYADILDATNKALGEMMDEMDRRFDLMKDYIHEKVIETEKQIIRRRYTYLFTYWMNCGNLKTNEEIAFCQREAQYQIRASADDFLLYQARWDDSRTNFINLNDEDRRKIEVNMGSFRNYAVLALVSLNTLRATYKLRSESVKKACDTLLWEREVLGTKDARPVPETDKLYACSFEQELTDKAAYFFKYGKACIDEIKALARNRLSKPLDTAVVNKCDPLRKHKYTGKGDFVISECTCDGLLHPIKSGKCAFKVMLMEMPDKQYYEKRQFNKESLPKLYGGSYDVNTELLDGDLVQPLINKGKKTGYWDEAEKSTTKIWCEQKFQRRRDEYQALEQGDIQLYWNNDIMKVVTCGTLLVEKKIDDCSEEILKSHNPQYYESVIFLKEASGSASQNGYDANRAIDGLFSTEFLSVSERNPHWSAVMERKAIITEVHVYIGTSSQSRKSYFSDKLSGSFEDSNELGITSDGSYTKEPITCKSPIIGFRVQEKSLRGITGLQFKCADGTESNKASDESGSWGGWSECPEGQRIYELKVRGQQANGAYEDRGATNIAVRCIDITAGPINFPTLPTEAIVGNVKFNRGIWTDWKSCQSTHHICGARVKIAKNFMDETGVNAIKVICCKGFFMKMAVDLFGEPNPNEARRCKEVDNVNLHLWDKPIKFKCEQSLEPLVANKVKVTVTGNDFLKLSEVRVFGYDKQRDVPDQTAASKIVLYKPHQSGDVWSGVEWDGLDDWGKGKCQPYSQPARPASEAIDGGIWSFSQACTAAWTHESDSAPISMWVATLSDDWNFDIPRYQVQSIAVLLKGKYKSVRLQVFAAKSTGLRWRREWINCGHWLAISEAGHGYFQQKCPPMKDGDYHEGVRVLVMLDYQRTKRLMIREIVVTGRKGKA